MLFIIVWASKFGDKSLLILKLPTLIFMKPHTFMQLHVPFNFIKSVSRTLAKILNKSYIGIKKPSRISKMGKVPKRMCQHYVANLKLGQDLERKPGSGGKKNSP